MLDHTKIVNGWLSADRSECNKMGPEGLGIARGAWRWKEERG